MFSAAENTWVHVTDIPSGPRLGIAAAVIGDALVLVGGFDKDTPEQSSSISRNVERYNILTKR